MKVEIIERIQLIRQFDEHLLAVWNYDGRDGRNYKPYSEDLITTFAGNEDANFI